MNALDFSQAVFIQDQQIKTDSLKVANAFGKNHRDVLRKIEKLKRDFNTTERNIALSEDNALTFELVEFTQHNFVTSEYIDSTGRVLPKYEMTKDGWMFLVMGFTGIKPRKLKSHLSMHLMPWQRYSKTNNSSSSRAYKSAQKYA